MAGVPDGRQRDRAGREEGQRGDGRREPSLPSQGATRPLTDLDPAAGSNAAYEAGMHAQNAESVREVLEEGQTAWYADELPESDWERGWGSAKVKKPTARNDGCGPEASDG